jgi:hypothetical protein
MNESEQRLELGKQIATLFNGVDANVIIPLLIDCLAFAIMSVHETSPKRRAQLVLGITADLLHTVMTEMEEPSVKN